MAALLPHPLTGRAAARRLWFTLAALLVLAAASLWLAHVELGWAKTYVALGIAAIKAGLVALVFMELTRSSTVIRFTAILVPLFIALLSGLVFADVALR